MALQPEILDLDILRSPEIFPHALGVQLPSDDPAPRLLEFWTREDTTHFIVIVAYLILFCLLLPKTNP